MNTQIDSIDLESNLTITKDASYNFDYLVFATGASPRLLPMENADSKNLFYLRQITDVLSMHQQITPDKEIVLIGGGYIGLEVASAMIELGLKVTILEAEERILQRVTSPEVSEFYNDFHSKKGVRIICNAKVTNLNAENQMIHSVSLESGESLAADIVLVGIGAIPNKTDFDYSGQDADQDKPRAPNSRSYKFSPTQYSFVSFQPSTRLRCPSPALSCLI